MQDLANRAAYLKRLGPGRTGNVAAMVGMPNAHDGDIFHTWENGQYTFTTAAIAPQAPFVYASSTTAGRWVSVLWDVLFGSSNPALVRQSLLPLPPYPRIVSLGTAACSVFAGGTQHITTSTYAQVNDGTIDLSASIFCAAGDHVRVSIGPIYGNTVSDGDTLTVNAHVIDGAANVDYPLTLVQPAPAGANVAQGEYLTLDHLVTTGGSIGLFLQAKCNVGGAGYVYFGAFGTSGSQWLRFEVIR